MPSKRLATASLCAIAACSFSLAAAAPAEDGLWLMQLTPAHDFLPTDGRKMDVPAWRINAAIATSVIQRFDAPRVVDYEHQTLNKEANGQPAPAAAWIKSLRWIEGQGLFALVELTARAKQQIDAKEYLFVSPVFLYHKETGDVLDLRMAALTNDPGIRGMQSLQAMQAAATAMFSQPPEETMNPVLKALLTALGLPETTTEQAALTAVNEIKAMADAARAGLKLQADDGAPAVQAACTALHSQASAAPDPAKFVPMSALEQVQHQLAALTAQHQTEQIEKLIAPALADGRLMPALEPWARELGQSSLAQLTAYLEKAQPLAVLSGTQTNGKPPADKTAGAHGLSAEDLAVCSAMGLTPEQFAAANK